MAAGVARCDNGPSMPTIDEELRALRRATRARPDDSDAAWAYLRGLARSGNGDRPERHRTLRRLAALGDPSARDELDRLSPWPAPGRGARWSPRLGVRRPGRIVTGRIDARRLRPCGASDDRILLHGGGRVVAIGTDDLTRAWDHRGGWTAWTGGGEATILRGRRVEHRSLDDGTLLRPATAFPEQIAVGGAMTGLGDVLLLETLGPSGPTVTTVDVRSGALLMSRELGGEPFGLSAATTLLTRERLFVWPEIGPPVSPLARPRLHGLSVGTGELLFAWSGPAAVAGEPPPVLRGVLAADDAMVVTIADRAGTLGLASERFELVGVDGVTGRSRFAVRTGHVWPDDVALAESHVVLAREIAGDARLAEGELVAIDRATGATSWRQPIPSLAGPGAHAFPAGIRTVVAAADVVYVAVLWWREARVSLQGFDLPRGEPLFAESLTLPRWMPSDAGAVDVVPLDGRVIVVATTPGGVALFRVDEADGP